MAKNLEQATFFYFLCNPGSESFLKEEIRLIYPELSFAFSTSGFVTFKAKRELGKTLRPVFCRHFGRFIMRGSYEEVLAKAQESKLPIRYYSKDGEIYQNDALGPNQRALEIIKVTNKNGDHFYLGEFVNSILTSPCPGGISLEHMPSESPSRAYLKAREAIEFVGAKLLAGDHALEIGSSPGGATYSLLQQGLSVEGIDPGAMAAVCLSHPNFIHHHCSIQDFKLYELKNHIQWLFVDMNLAPEATLAEIERIVLKIRPSLKGAFITLKMTKFELVKRVPMYLNLVSQMGLRVVVATQLYSHKQEFLIYAE